MAHLLDRYYTSNLSLLNSRLPSGSHLKHHAAPTPPPLLSAAARGRQQTLGPEFNEEEDGDDTEYISARMREMELAQAYHQSQSQSPSSMAAAQLQQLRLQQQALQVQQQYLLQQLLSSQPLSINRGQPGAQDARTMQFQQLQMQQMQVQAQIQVLQIQLQKQADAQALRQAQAQAPRAQSQIDPRVQAQLLAHLQASAKTPAQQAEMRAKAAVAQAQLQVQIQARVNANANTTALAQAEIEARAKAEAKAAELERTEKETERDIRSRFESQPNTTKGTTRIAPQSPGVAKTTRTAEPPSPVRKDLNTNTSTTTINTVSLDSPTKVVPLGRFAQARQTAGNPFGELTALLARRSAEQDQAAKTTITPPTPRAGLSFTEVSTAAPLTPTPTYQVSDDCLAARSALQSLGHGRPTLPASTGAAAQLRTKSNPFPFPFVSPTSTTTTSAGPEQPTVRAVSLGQPMKPIRQPFGPPAPVNELGERNFQAMARKKAGKGLGMLVRRGEGSGQTSPAVA